MPAFIVAVILAVSTGAGLLVWLMTGAEAPRRAARANLVRGLTAEPGKKTGRQAWSATLSGFRATPQLNRHLSRLVAGAGSPSDWSVERVFTTKLVAAGAGTLLGVLILMRNPGPMSAMLMLFLACAGFLLPDLLLWNIAIKRREAIGLELADTLDQMSIAVEAGLGFDAAMARVARGGKGILASELVRTLQDIQVGLSRRKAYESLGERCGVPALRRFVRSIIQAEEYGIALGDVLNAQAKEMRTARRQNAERKAMEIPVKVTFPLILLILPALMIVIMGPAVLRIVEAFSG